MLWYLLGNRLDPSFYFSNIHTGRPVSDIFNPLPLHPSPHMLELASTRLSQLSPSVPS